MRVAKTVGSISLLAFVVFIFFGPRQFVTLSQTAPSALIIDLMLSLAFFAQHSGMVRQSFQNWLARFVPHYYTAAIYAIAAGMVLLVIFVLWQPTAVVLFSATGLLRIALRGLFVLALFGFSRGTSALSGLDGFGLRPIKVHVFGKRPRDPKLSIRGPYKWVRHPVYTMVLVMIWACPDLTADRLLFNLTWTIWVFVATLLEERDLVVLFGDDYRQYQKQVGMLVPWRFSLKK